jgi:hypothetical protein
MSKSYSQGMIDGIELWGKACSKQGDCSVCPIGVLKGANITCQDFAKQFPAKMVSILKEIDEEQITYYEEYLTRFPECQLAVEAVADLMCRKLTFEGYTECEDGDCLACWQEKYVGDVTEDREISTDTSNSSDIDSIL